MTDGINNNTTTDTEQEENLQRGTVRYGLLRKLLLGFIII